MKDFYLSLLRDQTSSLELFRSASQQLASLLLAEASKEIPLQKMEVQTIFGQAAGKKPSCRVVLVPILRAGLALLPSALALFPNAPIGMFGIKRDEKTAEPHLYYQNLPTLFAHDWIFLLDPMLATGGSACLAIEKLVKAGAAEERITLISLIASKMGCDAVRSRAPAVKQILGAADPELNANKFIVPGLGDFGDRFFMT